MRHDAYRKAALLALLVVPFYPGVTGNREGNGGDHVRATFIRMGRAVVAYLRDTREGARILAGGNLDLGALEDSLTIHRIEVTEGELKDNGGSDVDAVGEPGRITLRKQGWMEHFERERDVYYLVFHEMLRSAGVNDDDYVHSEALHPFPASLKVATRINPLLPLVSGDLVADMMDEQKVTVAGTGCSSGLDGTYVDFDSERNILDISLDRYRMSMAEPRKGCHLAVPLTVPAGKRLVISQLDLAGKVALPQGTKAQINLEAFVAGLTGPKYRKTVSADTEDLVGRVQVRLGNVYATACGGSPILRLNTSGSVGGGASASMRIERLSLYFRVEECGR